MALDDVDQKGSPGWWFKRLAQQQFQQTAPRPSTPLGRTQPGLLHLPRARRLEELQLRYDGDPPLPEGAERAREAYRAFQRLARTTYEEVIVRAVLDRQTPVGFRVGDSERGDAAAAVIWNANQMAVQSSDILEAKLSLSEGYAIVGPADDESEGHAVITFEDPRQVIVATDPMHPLKGRAALKTIYDPEEEQDVAYVYLPGANPRDKAKAYKATRPGKASLLGPSFKLNPQRWTWADQPTEFPTSRLPVVRFRNRGGFAEFEKHIDLIDRIRHGILQRMVMVTMQAFRQRAVKGLPDRYPQDWPEVEKRGTPIDYDGLFVADPAAVWLLPGASEMWESSELLMTGPLQASKDDIRELGAVTRTPFDELMPDSANQTAEGATNRRESIVYKVEDHNNRDGMAFAQVMSLAFEMDSEPDPVRAKMGALSVMWAPVERFSLSQKSSSGVAAEQSGLSKRFILENCWQLPPEQIDRELNAGIDDAFTAAIRNAGQPNPPQPPAGQPGGQPQTQPQPGQGATGDTAGAGTAA